MDEKWVGDENKRGQGFNDARGEVADKKDIPKHNGLNVNNDPSHLAERRARQKAEKRRARADGSEASTEEAYKRMEKRQLRTSRES